MVNVSLRAKGIAMPITAVSFRKVALLAALSVCATQQAYSSVVVSGTRIIYQGNDTEKNVQLTNTDAFPNVVEAWVDSKIEDSTPENAEAPFIVNPPVFRMEPKSGQTIRLMHTGQNLPQDRESVYYLNVLQIPPKNEKLADQQQMIFLFKNQLKVFYRPAGIKEKQDQQSTKLHFKLNQDKNKAWYISAQNKSAYYASFGDATLQSGNQQIPLKAVMVAPFGEAQWRPVANNVAKPTGQLKLRSSLINDYGSKQPFEYEVRD